MKSNRFSFLRLSCHRLDHHHGIGLALSLILDPARPRLQRKRHDRAAAFFRSASRRISRRFAYVIQNSPIFRWYFNTVLVASVITVVSILVSLMCAYALSIMEFKGKLLINVWLLLGFMIPFGAMVIPLFMLMNQMHFVNSHSGVILPQIATPLSVIVFKRFFDQVPKDFRDAATIDGAKDFQVLFNIYIPLNWSIIWAMAIITFIGAWNNFLWPFIVTNSTPMLTIPVGMTQVQSAYGVAFAKTSAVAVMASIPTALAYIIFQKRVTQGVVAAAGIK